MDKLAYSIDSLFVMNCGYTTNTRDGAGQVSLPLAETPAASHRTCGVGVARGGAGGAVSI